MAKDSANRHSNGNGSHAPDAQIASSNSTFNMFVGGRQPSWLTDGLASITRPQSSGTTTTRAPENQTRPRTGGDVHRTKKGMFLEEIYHFSVSYGKILATCVTQMPGIYQYFC